jgi:hypothetical protein
MFAAPLRIVFPIWALVHALLALLILMVNVCSVVLWTLLESVETFASPVALTTHFLSCNLTVLYLLKNVHNMMEHLPLTAPSQCIIWNSHLALVMEKVSLFKGHPISLTFQMSLLLLFGFVPILSFLSHTLWMLLIECIFTLKPQTRKSLLCTK